MSKLVLVETVSTFRHTYVIKLPDDEPNDYALDDVIDSITGGPYQGKMEELTQHHIAEDIYNHRVITETEYLQIFDRDNSYLSDWEPMEKFKFIFDSAKARSDQIHKEVNWGPDVGREILSEDC
jgi:hypothetical protein